MTASLSIIADQQILLAEEVFSNFGNVELVNGRSIDPAVIKNADVLLVRSVTRVDEALLKESNIRFVGSATSGIDHIDTDYLKAANIRFVHAPGCNARSVAEYVLSSLFATAEYNTFDLTKKTVGIIGCGQVGSRVKRFMDVLGVHCLANDPPLEAENAGGSYVALERVLEADIISLHVPLVRSGNHATAGLVNKTFLDQVKSDVVLINTSRGEVIDEAALLAFQQANPKSTLILDVWCNEPKIDIQLLNHSFIGTPHIAGYSYDGKLKATKVLAEALQAETNITSHDLPVLASEAVADAIEYYDDNAIASAIMRSYDVRSDAIALGELSNMPIEAHAGYFDSLRKNYPIRREFTNREINTNKLNHELQQRLQDLGFQAGAA